MCAANEKPEYTNKLILDEIWYMQRAGLHPWKKWFTVYYFVVSISGLVLEPIMMVLLILKDETPIAIGLSHYWIVQLKEVGMAMIRWFNLDVVEKFYRALDQGMLDYGPTMDAETLEEIRKFDEEKEERKRIFSKSFRMLICIALAGAVAKHPLLYIITGHGVNKVDGSGGLIQETPFPIFVPYAEYWGPYIVGIILQHNISLFLCTTVVGTTSSYIGCSEEIVHQLRIVQLGLKNLLRRADHLSKVSNHKHEDFDDCLKKCLASTVKHHILIIELFSDFRKWMFFPLFTVIFYSGVMLCFGVHIMLSGESFAANITLPVLAMAELSNTYAYCGYGEQITEMFSLFTQFDEVGEQLYDGDLMAHSLVLKPYINIIRSYSHIPKSLSALGFAAVNHENFGYILRTTYTFLNFSLNTE